MANTKLTIIVFIIYVGLIKLRESKTMAIPQDQQAIERFKKEYVGKRQPKPTGDGGQVYKAGDKTITTYDNDGNGLTDFLSISQPVTRQGVSGIAITQYDAFENGPGGFDNGCKYKKTIAPFLPDEMRVVTAERKKYDVPPIPFETTFLSICDDTNNGKPVL